MPCRTRGTPLALLANASLAYLDSTYILLLHDTAGAVASITDKPVPSSNASIPTLLDNIYDCVVSHACHDLPDLPSGLWAILAQMDVLETSSRLYPFEHMESTASVGDYDHFVANYYGYYYVTVLERMQQAVAAATNSGAVDAVPRLYVQVTSDSVVSPQLRILGFPAKIYERRPVWGSQVVYQLLQNTTDSASFFVRILHEGKEFRMESLDNFAAFVNRIRPTYEDCSTFYDNFY